MDSQEICTRPLAWDGLEHGKERERDRSRELGGWWYEGRCQTTVGFVEWKAFKGFRKGCARHLYPCALKRSLSLQSGEWFRKTQVDDRVHITDPTLLRAVTWKPHLIYKRIKQWGVSRNLIWYSFRPGDIANFQNKWLYKVSQKRKIHHISWEQILTFDFIIGELISVF